MAALALVAPASATPAAAGAPGAAIAAGGGDRPARVCE
jgi:hypothetical protein